MKKIKQSFLFFFLVYSEPTYLFSQDCCDVFCTLKHFSIRKTLCKEQPFFVLLLLFYVTFLFGLYLLLLLASMAQLKKWVNTYT